MDLRFKIIGEHVQAGWDKAGEALQSLKGKFADFFGGVKSGWVAMGGAIAAGFGVIYSAIEKMKDNWEKNLETMTDRTRNMVNETQTLIRKLEFLQTEKQKSRMLEDVSQQITEKQDALRASERKDEMQNVFQNAGEFWSRKWNKYTGAGDASADENERAALRQEILNLQLAKKRIEKKDVKGDKQDEIDAASDARFERDQAALKKKVDAEKKALDEIAAAKKKAFDAEDARSDKMFERDQSELKKRIADAAKISDKQRDADYETASPADKRKMDLARLNELAGIKREFGGNTPEAREQRTAATLEEIDINKRLQMAQKEEQEKQAAARKAAAGQSLSVGDLFTRSYGQTINGDPALIVAKDSGETLKRIEKKLGLGK